MMKLEKMEAGRAEVRKFGFLFSGICALAAAFFFWKGSPAWLWFAGGTAFFLLGGIAAYPVLKPVYVGWMTFASILGWINTRVILGLFFYLIITPVGLVMRLLGKDPMQRKIDRSAKSYWITREPGQTARERYENLF